MNPVRQPDPSFIPYTAGFIDGEGCITITRRCYADGRPPCYDAVLSVANTDPRPLTAFREA